MPSIVTRYFGELTYEDDAAYEFPAGIPGFEGHTRFLFVEQPHAYPLVFMQSFQDTDLCFLSVPVFVADPDYRLELASEDRATLGMTPDSPLRIGADVACLVLVTVAEGADPTANLASPIVLNLHNRKGTQAIQTCSVHSFRHPLLPREEAVPC